MHLGEPLFELCCFRMGITQIALDSPTLCQTGTVEHFFRTLFLFSVFFLKLPKLAKRCTIHPGKHFDPFILSGAIELLRFSMEEMFIPAKIC